MIKSRYQKMYTEKYKQDMDFVIIGDNCIGPFVNMDVAQKAVNAINGQFSQQPKRTRTEYEKVTESIFDLRDEFERGELYTKKFNQEWHQIKTEEQLGNLLSMNDDPTKNGIYRKVEKETDERQEFIDAACSVIEDCHGERRQYVVEALFDSGKFKFIG